MTGFPCGTGDLRSSFHALNSDQVAHGVFSSPFLHISCMIGSHRHAKMSKYVHYRDKQMRVLCDVLTETQNQWGPEQSTHSGALLGRLTKDVSEIERCLIHPVMGLGRGMGGGGHGMHQLPQTKNSRHLLLWVEVVSWEAEGSKGHPLCFIEKLFCDVLFPAEDTIVIFCSILQHRSHFTAC